MSVIYKAMRNLQRKKAEETVAAEPMDAPTVVEAIEEERPSVKRRGLVWGGAGLVVVLLGGWLGYYYLDQQKQEQVAQQQRLKDKAERERRAAEDASAESLGDLKLESVVKVFSKGSVVPMPDYFAMLEAALPQQAQADPAQGDEKPVIEAALPDALERFLSLEQLLEEPQPEPPVQSVVQSAVAAAPPPPQAEQVAPQSEEPEQRGREVDESSTLVQLESVRQLTLDLSYAMQKGQAKSVAKLLTKLRQSRGEDHPIVLKMEAFWDMKNQRYGRAIKQLYKVLYTQPQDRDARFNLVVAQLHVGQLREAKRGLRALREEYPEDLQIAQLMKRYVQ
ncbi:hypothetical protein Mmc1_0929 [Magnetococcus marinus MC-1]|uniref:Uncharacterized protein n=1 Tax=Magnetococcus marinus (strain ATCC BAA-1437 / JCM 17883 / MC-1) TaxID=156889 RepID=A0L654_MAGMM|nr:tetratricopeptide repeat protein [Magnetococcus marinus]ABK43447.1 hypothetical protein Mmc1_0929 [Magnetococcus marinus MC-1]